jgi:hypothetical protein
MLQSMAAVWTEAIAEVHLTCDEGAGHQQVSAMRNAS